MRNVTILISLSTAICYGQYWQQVQDYPGMGRDNAAAFSIDTKIYVGTGYQTGSGLATDWFAYDIVGSGTGWSPIAPLPSTPRQYCTGIDGGFLFGGLDANGPLDELWFYNSSTNSWTQLASLPAPGRYGASTFTLNNRIFVANGMLANGICTNEFWEYIPASDTWVQLPNVPGPPRHLASSFINHPGSDVYGYVAGGTDSTFQAFQDVWCFERTTEVWTQVASLPEARYAAGSAYVLGGSSGALGPTLVGGSSTDSIFYANGLVYEPVSDTWTDLGAIVPRGTSGAVMASASGGGGWNMTLFSGGLDSTFMRRSEVYVTAFVFGISEYMISSFVIHPNPGNTFFALQLPTDIGPADLEVFDLTGREIMNERLTSSIVDPSTWPVGIYTVHVISADGDRYSARWVKL